MKFFRYNYIPEEENDDMMPHNNNMMFNNNIPNNKMMFNNNMPNNNMMFNNNIPNNNMMENNNQLNNNLNYTKIKLIFRNTKGNSYEIFASPDESFGKIVHTLLQAHKEIDKKNIGTLISNAQILKMQKTIKDNKLKNNSIIMIPLK